MDYQKKIICWWSGGITSAVACKLAIDLYGVESCQIIMLDTRNEHEDTYRFKSDCEKWYGKEIELISAFGDKYESIHDVWYRSRSLNVANGAICSSILKRDLRINWQKQNTFKHQVFGFEFTKKEFNRALSVSKNYPEAKALFPLLMLGYDKHKCIEIVESAGIKVPDSYLLGFNNNNCLGTGCVQGGIGYWQKMHREFPEKYNAMAKVEHDLTDLRGYQVTMCKDQSEAAQSLENPKDALLFLLPHPDFPQNKTVLDVKGREPKPLMDCNGIGCAVNDLNPVNNTANELNYQPEFQF